MADDPHGQWKPWCTFPKGDLKDDITNAWSQAHHDGGTHWAIQIYGTNPISGYRVRTPLVGAQDPVPTGED
jgi:hypothetical protein